MLEENVTITRSTGDECFICERKIRPQETVLEVMFKVPVIVTTATVREQAHLSCAEIFTELLRRRLAEAGR